ncbi:retrovirus-related pol polyprotein from transposon TNT 1-94 [Tanacetum coccineum]
MLTKPQFIYDHTTKQALGFQNPFYLKKAQQLEPKLYVGNIIEKTNPIVIPDYEDTLILVKESRSKMLLKQKDPMMLEKKVITTPNSVSSFDPTPSNRPTNVEVPKELPKVSMVNTSLKKLKHHLAGFDVVVKERTTPTAITEGMWGFEHTKACFRDEIIPFVKALKDLFNTFNKYLVDELSDVQNVFYQMEQDVEQHRLESKTFEVKMNQVLNKNERLLEQVISKDIVNIIANSSVDNASVNAHECQKCLKLETELQTDFEIFQRDNYVSNQSAISFDQLFELNELKAQSQEKDTVIKKLKERIKSLSGKMDKDKIKQDLEKIETINIELDHRVIKFIAENKHLKQTYKKLYDTIKPAPLKDDLRKLKGKALVDNDVSKHLSDPKMLKIDVEYLNPRLLNNRSAHSDYLKHTQEEAVILREIVEQGKSQNPLNTSLNSALAVTPKNKDKRVRFTEPVTSSGNTHTHTKTSSPSNLVSNKPMLSSTGVKPSTSASGSQPSSNTKKDKILQTPSSTQKNKVEAHPRKVKSSLKNKDYVVEPKGTAPVQHSKLNANSKLKCVKCNGCMISDNHDLCVLDFTNNVNARAKSKSVKKSSKRKVWKPIGKVITITTKVPLWKPASLDNETSKPVVTLVYSRKPRKSKTNVPVSKSKVVRIVLWYLDSGCSNHMTGDRSQLTNFVNKFLGIVKFGNDHVAKMLRYGDYQIGNVTILRVYYVEGLGHNLFSVGSKDEAPDFIIKFLKMIQVRLNVTVQRIRTDNGTEFQNGIVERCNRTLIEAARTMLIYAKAPLFLWAEAVATAYFDELTVMASKQSRLGPALYAMTPATISSGLMPNPPPSTPLVPPSRTDWDILFQPMFDELFTPLPSVDLLAPEVIAPINEVVAPVPDVSTGSPSSTNVDQDAPSPSNSQTTPETQPPTISNDVEEDNHDIEVAHMSNDPYFGVPILEVPSEQSSSSDSIHTTVHPDH